MVFQNLNKRCKYSSFKSDEGASEYFAVIESDGTEPFLSQLDTMYEDLKEALVELNITEKSLVFTRFYLSDIANQNETLIESKLYSICSDSACSIIQQSPLGVGEITLLLYFIDGDSFTKEVVTKDDGLWHSDIKLEGVSYTQYWSANYVGGDVFDSYKQTDEIFNSYISFLKNNNITVYDNVMRTWIYVRDIDNHYAGMVEARKELFERCGLTHETHYIASTGIEARLKDTNTLVSMDALAVDGIVPKQVVQLEALENLNPTHEYGVTFERGTKLIYGDREHYYISGTASIDKHGDVVFVGDVVKQTDRALDNIEALLNPHAVNLSDMAYLIVYIRNVTQEVKVLETIRNRVGDDVPIVLVHGAVCRPAWLVEIEGVAIRRSNSEFPNFF